jgi:hypothetical protein
LPCSSRHGCPWRPCVSAADAGASRCRRRPWSQDRAAPQPLRVDAAVRPGRRAGSDGSPLWRARPGVRRRTASGRCRPLGSGWLTGRALASSSGCSSDGCSRRFDRRADLRPPGWSRQLCLRSIPVSDLLAGAACGPGRCGARCSPARTSLAPDVGSIRSSGLAGVGADRGRHDGRWRARRAGPRRQPVSHPARPRRQRRRRGFLAPEPCPPSRTAPVTSASSNPRAQHAPQQTIP